MRLSHEMKSLRTGDTRGDTWLLEVAAALACPDDSLQGTGVQPAGVQCCLRHQLGVSLGSWTLRGMTG